MKAPPKTARMAFPKNVAMTAPATSYNAIQRVQRGTNRPVGKIRGKIIKQLRATILAELKTHSQAGWRTTRMNGSGVLCSGKVATITEAKSTIQSLVFCQNSPAAVSNKTSDGIPICRAANQPYRSSVRPRVSSASTWSGRRGSAKPTGGPGQPTTCSPASVRRICCLSVHGSSSQTVDSKSRTARKPSAYMTVSTVNPTVHASRAMRSQRPPKIVLGALSGTATSSLVCGTGVEID